jgi:3-hydroxybutyryl-CoA dehydrogenase
VDIGNVGVVGCGTMGSGICQVVALAGVPVTFVEVDEDRVAAARERIAAQLGKRVERGRLERADADAALERITGETRFDAFAGADLVIEAVPEDLDLKKETFAELDRVCPDHTVLATNTSSLPVMDLAVATRRSNRVLGFHFFNPAPVMELIELVRTVVADPQVVEDAKAFASRLGKTPVVAQDRAGFIANLLLFPYLNQAVAMHEGGYASGSDIDTAMQLGAGHPMGPLALLDLIGLDSGTAIMESLERQFAGMRYVPRPLLRHLVAAGFTGRKSGRGFFGYGEDAGAAPRATVDRVDPGAVSGWRRVGVVGTGTMATGIAEVCATAGYEVVVRGRSVERAQGSVDGVAKSYAKAVEKGKMAEADRDAALGRLTATDDFADLGDADVIVEAVAEDIAIKRELFAAVDKAARSDALLATTTSSLPVVDCAMATSRPERVVGLHFFNPARVMKLVEVVDTARTEPGAIEQGLAFADAVGKRPVRCSDRAGFVVNALLFPYLNDAVKMLDAGYATVADIDTAMKLGCNHPMGPFELMDVVGLDVTLEICRALHAEFRDPDMAPSPLLEYMVRAGYLGRKTGRGFHNYE